MEKKARKPHSMDKHLLALTEPHEVRYFKRAFKVGAKVLRAVVKELSEHRGIKTVSRDLIIVRLTELNLISSPLKSLTETDKKVAQDWLAEQAV